MINLHLGLVTVSGWGQTTGMRTEDMRYRVRTVITSTRHIVDPPENIEVLMPLQMQLSWRN